MTFRGNLLLYSLWYELHPFENLRRKGHHCHGLTHLSWGEHKFFYRVLGKIFMGCSFTLDRQCGRLWLYEPPATGTHTGVWHPAGNEQGPAATTESACAKRRCTLHPGGLLTGCKVRRSQRDRGGATGTVSASPGVSRIGPYRQPETAPAGSAETGGCASSCQSESGLTTGCLQAAGSRR